MEENQFPERSHVGRWMWNTRQMLLGVGPEGAALPPSLALLTTESQWRSLVLTAGGNY